MSKIDYKHIAFHTIVAFYFIWLIVFTTLNIMALANAFGEMNNMLSDMLTTLIVLNMFMGIALFLVFRLFRNKSILDKIVRYTFGAVSVLSVTTVLVIKFKS